VFLLVCVIAVFLEIPFNAYRRFRILSAIASQLVITLGYTIEMYHDFLWTCATDFRINCHLMGSLIADSFMRFFPLANPNPKLVMHFVAVAGGQSSTSSMLCKDCIAMRIYTSDTVDTGSCVCVYKSAIVSAQGVMVFGGIGGSIQPGRSRALRSDSPTLTDATTSPPNRSWLLDMSFRMTEY
jgi:hypothetical protein